jgi:hypothetical protein
MGGALPAGCGIRGWERRIGGVRKDGVHEQLHQRLLRWLLRHRLQTRSNSLECTAKRRSARPALTRASAEGCSRSVGIMARFSPLGDNIPPDLPERYDRKRDKCENQRKHRLACSAANGRHDDHHIRRTEDNAEGILRILEAEGTMNIFLPTEGDEARTDDCAGNARRMLGGSVQQQKSPARRGLRIERNCYIRALVRFCNNARPWQGPVQSLLRGHCHE